MITRGMRKMQGGILDFSARGWGRVILWTVLGTLGCVAVALYVDSFNFPTMTPDERTRAIAIDIALPICLAVPMLLFLTIKLRELAVAHHDLARLASMDALTSVLNRGAFTALVEGYLAEVKAQERGTRGALLLIDADNFKSINDAWGHESGDEALKMIARTIRNILRGADIVGRVGGEEFGIFLPGSTAPQAEHIAERIRRAIAEAGFSADGALRSVSVSIGGAVFDRQTPFDELFRLADQQLYAAKRGGRNRVLLASLAGGTVVPAAA